MLAETTAAEKADLLARVKELETELSVWKQAHTAAREAAERDSKARDDQQFALVKRPTSSTGSGSDGAVRSPTPSLAVMLTYITWRINSSSV